MGRASFTRNGMAGVCGAAMAVSASFGFAQTTPAPPSTDKATTVTPLTVNGLAPVPNVGAGATWFSPQELAESAHLARMDSLESKDARNQCHTLFGPRESETWGDFSLEALYNSEYEAQDTEWKAGQTAQAATQGALDIRAAAARGEADDATLKATELARQAAVRAFQAAQEAASEAHLRVADYQDLAQIDPDATDRQLQPQIEARSLERAHNAGVSGVYVPGVFADLRLSDIAIKEEDSASGKALKVSGNIVNTRGRAIEAPPLWVSAVDKFGTPLSARQMEAPAKAPRIGAGATAPFTLILDPMPDKTARAVVTFAPFHHQPRYLPVALFCQ